MKILFKVVLTTILCGLTSCNFTEEMHLNEDGSGKVSINFDGSQLMQMAGDQIAKEDKKAIDSTFSFKDVFEAKKDSIAKLSKEEQEKLKKLEPFTMHMLMNPESKEMKFEMFTDFSSVSELGDVFNSFQEASKLQANNGNATSANPMGDVNKASSVDYSFNGERFNRHTTIIDEELHQRSIDSLDQANMFLAGSTYTLKYHFPKKIKSVNKENAMLSADGKTLTLEADYMSYMKDPKILDVEVELEK